jgi:hypothetical protein
MQMYGKAASIESDEVIAGCVPKLQSSIDGMSILAA